MITELRDFYILDGKLLYTSKDFIGYDPYISKGLSYITSQKSGERVNFHTFEMNNSSFNATLTSFLAYGPVRGYKRVEIMKNGMKLLRYERGGKGFGINYSEGNRFLIDNSDAFMVAEGYSMLDFKTHKVFLDRSKDDDYLFWFQNITIPKKFELDPDKDSLMDKKPHSAREIEHLRQIEWEAVVKINKKEYFIRKSSIPGFTLFKSDESGQSFKRFEPFSALSKTEIQLVDKE